MTCPSTRLPSAVAEAAHRQRGIVTGRQLRRGGVDPASIERLRSRNVLTRIHRDLYRVVGTSVDFESACVTVCLAHEQGAIGGPSAAALWGFDHVYRPFRPEFVLPPGVVIDHPVRRTTYRPEPVSAHVDVVEQADGIRVFSKASTWFDCVGELRAQHATVFTRHVLQTHCEPAEMWEVVDRWEASRHRRARGRSHRLLTSLCGPSSRTRQAA